MGVGGKGLVGCSHEDPKDWDSWAGRRGGLGKAELLAVPCPVDSCGQGSPQSLGSMLS